MLFCHYSRTMNLKTLHGQTQRTRHTTDIVDERLNDSFPNNSFVLINVCRGYRNSDEDKED